MSQDIGKNKNKVYKVVLTGGNVKPPKSYIQTRNMTISLGTEEVGCTHTWLQFLQLEGQSYCFKTNNRNKKERRIQLMSISSSLK
jgi:hypothetical protein